MKLKTMLEDIPHVVLQMTDTSYEMDVNYIACNSNEVTENSMFVCIEGTKSDGHDYIEDAWKKGASVCIVEKRHRKHRKLIFPEGMTVILVTDTKTAYSRMAAIYFGNPAEKLKVIGVTGTKGKTTVTYMIAELLQASGYRAGLIGTLGIQIGETHFSTENTTPDAFTIQKYFAKMVEMGCEYAILEVSSQSMKQKRVEGILFEAAVFTNFSADHIGPQEHKNIKEYRYYKSRVFQQTKCAIGNLDDMECSYMFRHTDCRKYGYTCKEKEQHMEKDQVLRAEKIAFRMDPAGPYTRVKVAGKEYVLRLPGIFNVYNLLAAIQTLQVLGIPETGWRECLEQLKIPGRMQQIFTDKNIACYVDYAHNALSLKAVLETMKRYHPKKLILVFGCGGNRARMRRVEMGEVAGQYADLTIITSDNPRFEEPKAIIEDIVSGMKKTTGRYQIVIDREQAIRYAFSKAREGDILIVAGKGHEAYQEIKGVRYPMCDQELIEKAYAETR